MTTEFTADTAKGLLLAACCGALTNTAGILLSLPFFRDRKKPTNAVFKFASVYGNMGYMALPLANAVLGPEGVFYCSAGIMMFQVFCFTHGVWMMSRDGDTNAKFEAKHLFLNPGVIAVCIGGDISAVAVSDPFRMQVIGFLTGFGKKSIIVLKDLDIHGTAYLLGYIPVTGGFHQITVVDMTLAERFYG